MTTIEVYTKKIGLETSQNAVGRGEKVRLMVRFKKNSYDRNNWYAIFYIPDYIVSKFKGISYYCKGSKVEYLATPSFEFGSNKTSEFFAGPTGELDYTPGKIFVLIEGN